MIHHAGVRVEELRPFGARIIGTEHARTQDIPAHLVRDLLKKHKMLYMRGFQKMERGALVDYVQGGLGSAFGMSTLDWEFGPVLELKEGPDPKNPLFSSERIPFHWDGAFFKVPSYLVFQCQQSPSNEQGGETIFANSLRLWDDASPREKAIWHDVRITYETAKVAHYGGRITCPLVQQYPGGPASDIKAVRFVERVTSKLNPVSMEIDGIPPAEQDRFVEDLERRLYSTPYCYSHAWEPGDLLIADNHALLHGRTAFQSGAPRHLLRLQLI